MRKSTRPENENHSESAQRDAERQRGRASAALLCSLLSSLGFPPLPGAWPANSNSFPAYPPKARGPPPERASEGNQAYSRRRGSGGSPAAVLQKQPTRRPSAGRSVYKWRRARRAAAASREGEEEEEEKKKRRRPLLPTGTARGIAPSPRRRPPPQVISRILRSPASWGWGLGFAAAAYLCRLGSGVWFPPPQRVSVSSDGQPPV
jgi:hypothetical protein